MTAAAKATIQEESGKVFAGTLRGEGDKIWGEPRHFLQ